MYLGVFIQIYDLKTKTQYMKYSNSDCNDSAIINAAIPVIKLIYNETVPAKPHFNYI
jgi:hypothetical protein